MTIASHATAIAGLRRKARQLGGDPVLRRWLIGRALGRWPGAQAITPGRPPYLNGLGPEPAARPVDTTFRQLPESMPDCDAILDLPGETIRVSPGEEPALMRRGFADTETLLALHRFAWLPLAGDDFPPSWVSALWRAWRQAHQTPGAGWAWHPYTVAERAINILDYARRGGLPGPRDETLALLARHGEAIVGSLEYFGERNTGNHLSNNGRGLFLLGLALGLDRYAEIGGRILIEEAARIFGPSGILREGSSHYHLLLTRNYASAWLAARAHGRPETEAFERITRRALAAIPPITLPGGMPLIGDISPDCPPSFLAPLLPDGDIESGWCGLLAPDDRAALVALRVQAGSAPREALAADGWHRFESGPWSALWHAAPGGWCAMPGHGHQDVGAFEVHFDGTPLFVDPGRGGYGDTAEAGEFVSARAHNSLTVDGADPYPPNKPYYDDAFRRAVAGDGPEVVRLADGLELGHDGFSRFNDVGRIRRRWRFAENAMTITDHVSGRGRHRVVRRLFTPHRVELSSDGATIGDGSRRFRLSCDGAVVAAPAKRWTAYGEAKSATVIEIAQDSALPTETKLIVEAV